MKKISLVILLLMTVGFVYSQDDIIYPNYIIKFTDKNGTPFSIDNPEEYLSTRAIERRNRQNIAVNVSDLPINPDYVQAIIDAGALVRNKLKWFNSVSAKIPNSSVMNQITALSFVSEVKLVSSDGVGKTPVGMQEKDLVSSKEVTLIPKSINDLNYGESYNQINMINGTQLHADGYLGQNILIAVFDGGFGFANEMTAFDSLWMNDKIIGTRDFVVPGGDVFDFDETASVHGSWVLSAMGAYIDNHLIGTAPKANYYLIRCEDTRDPGSEYLMEEYYWTDAAEFADSIGADIISASLSYFDAFYDPQFNHSYEEMDGNTTPITKAADMAASKGIFMVNSNGNQGSSSWYYMGAPADGDSVLSIGAVDASGNYASFSSHGPTYDGRIKPDVTAQGENPVLADIEGGITTDFSGTSFSTPIIAGMVACLWQANPTANNYQMLLAIRQSASVYTNPNADIGYGIPDFKVADQIVKEMVGIITPLANEINVKISPNPFLNQIQLEFNEAITTRITATIYDMHGQLIYRKTIQDQTSTINELENTTSGVYYLRLSKTNGQTSTYKLIKL